MNRRGELTDGAWTPVDPPLPERRRRGRQPEFGRGLEK